MRRRSGCTATAGRSCSRSPRGTSGRRKTCRGSTRPSSRGVPRPPGAAACIAPRTGGRSAWRAPPRARPRSAGAAGPAGATALPDGERPEAALRESQDRLRQMQKIEAVGSLAAGIAHDFNNLLTGILGSVDLALQSLPETHAAHAELQFTREAAQRATDLTRRLLTFSRQQALAPVHADLRDVVGGMQSLLRRTLGEQIRLEVTLGRAPGPAV